MDEIFDKMQGNEAAVAPYYAGDALMMMSLNEDLGFVIPREGTNLFSDAMCIPATARNKEAAQMYTNFLLEPQIGLPTANTSAIPPPTRRCTTCWRTTSNTTAFPTRTTRC